MKSIFPLFSESGIEKYFRPFFIFSLYSSSYLDSLEPFNSSKTLNTNTDQEDPLPTISIKKATTSTSQSSYAGCYSQADSSRQQTSCQPYRWPCFKVTPSSKRQEPPLTAPFLTGTGRGGTGVIYTFSSGLCSLGSTDGASTGREGRMLSPLGCFQRRREIGEGRLGGRS